MLQLTAAEGVPVSRHRSCRAAVLAALALGAAAGCYRGSAGLGDCEVSCAVDVQCPAGLVCGQSGRCTAERGARCDDVSGDGPVGDGPVADASPCAGHDEDVDSLPDVTDPCPASSFNLDDGDGDGLPTGCDPDDLEQGDSLALFDGFPGCGGHEESAGWMADVDQHLVRTDASPDLAWLRWAVPGIGTRFAMSAVVEVMGTMAPDAWIGIGRGLGGTTAGSATGFVCRIDLLPSAARARATVLPATDRDTALVADPVPTSQRFVLSYQSWPTATMCRFSLPDGAGSTDVISGGSGNTSDNLGLIAHGAEVHVHWFLVVAIDRP